MPDPLLAQELGGAQMWYLLAVLVAMMMIMVVVLSFFAFFARQLKRCPSNRVLVIFGRTGTGDAVTCVHGGMRLVIPLLQDYGWLSLDPIQIEAPIRDLSPESIRISVPQVFTVAIGTAPELMQNAAVRLLGLTEQAIKKLAEDIIIEQLRQVIGSMSCEDINRDRNRFVEAIRSSLEPQLRQLGLVLISFR